MKMAKKFLALATVFTLSIGVLAGCGSAKNDEAKKDAGADAKDEITFMIPDWGVPSDEMLQKFEKDSGVKVKVLPTSWDDIRDKVSTAAAGKKAAADVFEVDWSWVGEFKSADWLAPIDLDQKDVDDMPTVKSFTVDNKIYALPYANDFRIAYYNKDQYAKAGLEKAPATWEEVIANGKLLKEKKINEYPVSMPLNADESSTTTLLWLAYTRNGIVFNKDNTLNKESVLDALKVMNELNKNGLINPANRTSSGMDAYKQITSGDASFIVGPSSFVSRVNDPKESKVVDQVIPSMLPGKDGVAKATVPFAEAVGVSNYSKNPEAAMKFVKWYTSPETQIELNKVQNSIPTRNSILEKLIKDGKLKNTGAMLDLAKIIESPFPNGVPKYYTKMSTEMFNIINQMANEKLTPEQAADQMVQKVDAIVQENK